MDKPEKKRKFTRENEEFENGRRKKPMEIPTQPLQIPITCCPVTSSPTASVPMTSDPTSDLVTPIPTTSDLMTPNPTSDLMTPNPTSDIVTPNPTSDLMTPNPTSDIVTPNPTTSDLMPPNPTSDLMTPNPTSDIVTPNPTTSDIVTPNPTTSDLMTPNPTSDLVTPNPTTSDIVTPIPTTFGIVTPNPTTSDLMTPNPKSDLMTPNPTTSDLMTPNPKSDLMTPNPTSDLVTPNPIRSSPNPTTDLSICDSTTSSHMTSDPTSSPPTERAKSNRRKRGRSPSGSSYNKGRRNSDNRYNHKPYPYYHDIPPNMDIIPYDPNPSQEHNRDLNPYDPNPFQVHNRDLNPYDPNPSQSYQHHDDNIVLMDNKEKSQEEEDDTFPEREQWRRERWRDVSSVRAFPKVYYDFRKGHQSPKREILPLRSIPYWIHRDFRASGVLAYATHESEGYFLLSCENRTKKTGLQWDGKVWLNPGGKRELGECPASTALREFHEETASLFLSEEENIKNQLNDPLTRKYWFYRGKYVLFFCEIPFHPDISRDYSEKLKTNKHLQDDAHLDLGWIPYRSIYEAVYYGNKEIELEGKEVKLYTFLYSMLRMVMDLDGNL